MKSFNEKTCEEMDAYDVNVMGICEELFGHGVEPEVYEVYFNSRMELINLEGR